MAGCIICGIDDSGAARDAARVATALSERLGTRLVLVHAAELPTLDGMSRPELYGELLAAEVRSAENLLRAVARDVDLDERSEWRVEFGPPVDVLADAAEDERATLVVVGSRGLGKLRSAFADTVSGQLPNEAPCPVVVVSEGAAPRVVGEGAAAGAAPESGASVSPSPAASSGATS